MDYTAYTKLEFRRKFWKLFGASIRVTDPATDRLAGYIEMKAWKLREDIRMYADDTKQQELLRIHARQIIDFGATYDVFDQTSGETPLFSLRRKGLRSMFVRDHWHVLDAAGNQIGELRETSSTMALVRRYVEIIPFVGIIADLVLAFLPLSYQVRDISGVPAANIIHRKNPFIVKMGLDIVPDSTLDRRVSIAFGALLSVIDAAKN